MRPEGEILLHEEFAERVAEYFRARSDVLEHGNRSAGQGIATTRVTELRNAVVSSAFARGIFGGFARTFRRWRLAAAGIFADGARGHAGA
jgi:hypothetical protein